MTRSLLAALEAGLDPLDQKIWTIAAVARSLADLIRVGQPVSRQRLSRLMTEHFGTDDSSGVWSLRDAYDAIELAQVIAFLQRGVESDNDAQPDRALLAITALAERLPISFIDLHWPSSFCFRQAITQRGPALSAALCAGRPTTGCGS